MPSPLPSKKKGFTLIELSIVLVIIGLIIGGVLMGRDLMNAAKTRSAAAQLQQFQSIFNTFKLKYNCEAGDCPNASTFFGDYMVGTSCTSMTNGSGNGNGNGKIDDGGSSNWYCEGYNAVMSLKLANLMPSENNSEQIKGINNSFGFFYYDDVMGRSPVRNKSTLTWATSILGVAVGGAFSPMEGRMIDEKIDDGISNKGKFIGLDSAVAGSTASVPNSCSTSGVYNTNETQTCRSIFYYQ